MFQKIGRYCKKAIAHLIASFFQPEDPLELDYLEEIFEERTQALESLLVSVGISIHSARNMAIKVLMHDPNFDIKSMQYAHIRYALKARARILHGYKEPIRQTIPESPVWGDPTTGAFWQYC